MQFDVINNINTVETKNVHTTETVKTATNKYSSNDMLGIELCATFWHFLDILWVYLFLFFLYIL